MLSRCLAKGDRLKNAEYWRGRFKALEDEQYKKSREYIEDVERQFRRAQTAIQSDIEKWYYRLAENNDISYMSAKKLLKKDELEEFHWDVETYIKYGKENGISQKWVKELENASAKVHINRLEAIKLQLQQEAEKLYQEYHGGITDFLGKSYSDRFYHTAYEVAKGSGIGHSLAKIDKRKIEIVLTRPWAQDKVNFSDRIWANKDKLISTLHTELAQNVIRGEDPYKAVEAVSKKLNVSKNQAGTLVYTESAAIAAAAQKDCFQELGVEEFEIVATLDSITSEICRKMDGTHFPMEDYEGGITAPPFHCNCRSVTCPYFNDEFSEGGKRAARGEAGRTYYVPADMTYPEWKEKYVNKEDKTSSEAGDSWLGALGQAKGTAGKPEKLGQIDMDKIDDAVNYYNEIIRNKEVEHAVVIDKHGNLYYSIGNETNVNLEGIDLDGAVITHNHPASNGIVSFGEDDFKLLKANHGIKKIFAVNKEYTYSVKVIKDISKVSYGSYYRKALREALRGGDKELQHIVFEMLAQEGYIEYGRKGVK